MEPQFQIESASSLSVLDEPTAKDLEFLPQLRMGYFTICKVVDGTLRSFTFNTTVEGPGVAIADLYVPQVQLGNDECADVYAGSVNATGPDYITISEVLPEGWQVDRVFIWSIAVDANHIPVTTSHAMPAGTTTLSGSIEEGKEGCVVIFYNSEMPRDGDCTRTPGYWKTHPEAWPVDELEIGGITYSKSDALALLWTPERGDKSKTLFRALVAAKLNELSGTDVSCVTQEMSDADAWMAAHPACSNVRGNSDAWGEVGGGELLYTTLDDYNNGLLCAPHCEDGAEPSITESSVGGE